MTTIIILCYIWFVGSKRFQKGNISHLTDDLLEIESHLNIQKTSQNSWFLRKDNFSFSLKSPFTFPQVKQVFPPCFKRHSLEFVVCLLRQCCPRMVPLLVLCLLSDALPVPDAERKQEHKKTDNESFCYYLTRNKEYM